jgi:protein-S-isoprenylcysteine O-methyltransferase Ste14
VLLWLWSAVLGSWGLLTFRRLGTTHEPNGVPTTLIVSGPFLYSRNPLYVALCALLAGFGLLLDSAWPLLLTPVLVLLLDRLVIAKEERRLQAQFGEAYLSYQRRVGRWL